MKSDNRGKIIVFDGIDGTGKTTCINKVVASLIGRKMDVVRFREPSESKHGMAIREAMSGENRLPFNDELALFTKDRKWDVKNNIKPSIKEGKIVFLDRYYFSTAAYQGCRGVLDFKKIIEMNENFSPIPDVTFFFFADIDTCLGRISKGRSSSSYMEKKNNLVLVNDIFKAIHDSKKYNSFAIDASKTAEEVFDSVILIVESELARLGVNVPES